MLARLTTAALLALAAAPVVANDDAAHGLSLPGLVAAPAAEDGVRFSGAFADPLVEPTQLQASPSRASAQPRATPRPRLTRSPSDRPRFSTASLRTGMVGGTAFAGLASVPYMIGDTGAGTCMSFATIGYFEADISHPTLTCSRLNIAENNRAITSDRAYFSYRHFENASPGRVFQFNQLLNVDRYTLGLEKTLGDGSCSIEIRLPFEYRLTSNMLTRVTDINPPDTLYDEGSQLLGEREMELANISAIFKTMLAEHDGFVLSAGLGVTAPTARDVRYGVDIQNIVFTYFDLVPPFITLSNFQIDAHFTNETWYLSPFLAYASRQRSSPFFHQGFAQVEIAANPMRVRFSDTGSASVVSYDGVNPAFGAIWTVDGAVFNSVLRDLHAQPLLRLNLGGGCFLIEESDRHSLFEQLVAMAELHYTTPLQDAKVARIPLDFVGVDPSGDFTGAFEAFDPFIGNRNSRVDILNGVVGLSAKVNGTTITNGFTFPLRTGDNRAFDFEYNLQVQRPF